MFVEVLSSYLFDMIKHGPSCSEDPYGLVGKTLAFYAFLLCIDGATIVTDSEVPMYMDRLRRSSMIFC
uniref:Uncharacterized protein n=1 Tax=Triticum urartu TaxID=4572 RepID=A0A8R7V5P8_TRIUA